MSKENESPELGMLHVRSPLEVTILLIEDDPTLRRILTGKLERIGYRVHSVGCTDVGARYFLGSRESGEGTYHVVISDDRTPGTLEGNAFLAQLRVGGYGGGLILMSGTFPHQDPSAVEYLRQHGINFASKETHFGNDGKHITVADRLTEFLTAYASKPTAAPPTSQSPVKAYG